MASCWASSWSPCPARTRSPGNGPSVLCTSAARGCVWRGEGQGLWSQRGAWPGAEVHSEVPDSALSPPNSTPATGRGRPLPHTQLCTGQAPSVPSRPPWEAGQSRQRGRRGRGEADTQGLGSQGSGDPSPDPNPDPSLHAEGPWPRCTRCLCEAP